MFKRAILSGASFAAVVISAGLAVSPALAQDDITEVQEVEVTTGSFIQGTPENAALPVDVIGADELQRQGTPSTVELLKALTVSNGVLGDTNQFDARAQGSEGAATVNLRGLGASRTLVLFNGRRLVNAPIGAGAPDINLLPQAAIGRIEVLKDGAAATYGSDAIGGVVNFITRRDLEGFQVSGDYRWINGSDGDYGASIAYGRRGDWGNLLLTAGYQHRSELSILERDFTQVPYLISPESGWSSGGMPSAFVPVFGTTAVQGLTRDVGCAPLGGTPGFSGTTATPVCFWNYTPYDNLVEREERYQLYAELNYNITDTTRLHLEALYSHTDTPEWATSPSYLALQAPTATTSPIPGVYYVPGTNPGLALYRTQNPTAIPGIANGVYFPGSLFRPLGLGGNPLFGDNSSRGSREYNAYRISAGLSGDFPGGNVHWDVGVTYMTDNLVRVGYDSIVSRLQLALRGYGSLEGGTPCTAAATNNFTTGAGSAALGCYYFNPFSNGIAANAITGQTNPAFSSTVANDPNLIRWFFQPTSSDLTTRTFVIDAVINGELGWTLGGGQVGWAAGAQFRNSGFESSYDALTDLNVTPCIDTPVNGSTNCTVRNGPFLFLGGALPANLEGDVMAVFGEVALPFTDTFGAHIAARYEDYGAAGGSTFNPKLDLRWQAVDWLAFRGSVGTTFRAPPLTALDASQVTSLQFLGGGFRAVDITGNPNLEPETAFTYSVGAIIEAGNFRATVDYWSFDFSDPIVTEPVSGIYNTMFPGGSNVNCGAPAFAALQARFTFNTSGCGATTLTRIATNVINGPSYRTDGVDVIANYRIQDVIGGDLQFGATVTYVRAFEVDATSVAGVVVLPAFDGAGQLNYQTQIVPIPQWKAQLFGEYTSGPHNVRLTVNFIDGYRDQRTEPFTGNLLTGETAGTAITTPRSQEGREIGSYTTLDAVYRLRLPHDTTMVFTVNNVLDEDPPFARLDLGYDPFTANPLGRTFKIAVTPVFLASPPGAASGRPTGNTCVAPRGGASFFG